MELRLHERTDARWQECAHFKLDRRAYAGVPVDPRGAALEFGEGKRPVWGQSIMRKQIHPTIEKLGIEKRIGWHTFRHSYSTLLRHLGTDIKVQQHLLRHSSARLTLDTYTQALTPAKREAQNAIVQLLLPAKSGPLAAPTTSKFKYKHLGVNMHALAGEVAPFCTYEEIAIRPISRLECMAGTTGLEPATSAVTVLPF